jgi:hypothetical protein
LAMAGVESAVLCLLVWCQLCKRFLNVGEHVVSGRDDEQRGVGEDAGAAGKVAQREAAVTFSGDCTDGVVWISCWEMSVSLCKEAVDLSCTYLEPRELSLLP